MEKLSKGLFFHTCVVFGTRQHVDCRNMFLNKISYAFKYQGVLKRIISKIFKKNISKFYRDFKNGIKFFRKVFIFEDKWIWIGCGKFEYYRENT